MFMNVALVIALVLGIAASGIGSPAQEASQAGAPSPGKEDSQKSEIDPAPEKGGGPAPSEKKVSDSPPDQEDAKAKSVKPPPNPSPGPAHKKNARERRVRARTGDSRKVVIHHGGATDPVSEIVPGITPEEANRQRESADELLAASDASLHQLGTRPLNPHQAEVIIQIRQYMDSARNALKESDPQRAHTLALKAYLLSDDMVNRGK
jgi:hypothetical protein